MNHSEININSRCSVVDCLSKNGEPYIVVVDISGNRTDSRLDDFH
jgi:hypothetical protein